MEAGRSPLQVVTDHQDFKTHQDMGKLLDGLERIPMYGIIHYDDRATHQTLFVEYKGQNGRWVLVDMRDPEERGLLRGAP